MDGVIDHSWYERPPDVPVHVCAGGIVARVVGVSIYIALVREGDFPHYVIPKGHVHHGESLEKAAQREIEEETGFTDLTLVEKLGVKERLDFRKTEWKKTHYFLFATDQVRGNPTDDSVEQGPEWFQIETIPSLFWPEQKDLIENNRDRICRLLKRNFL